MILVSTVRLDIIHGGAGSAFGEGELGLVA